MIGRVGKDPVNLVSAKPRENLKTVSMINSSALVFVDVLSHSYMRPVPPRRAFLRF